MRYLLFVTAAFFTVGELHAYDRWASDVSTEYGIVTKVGETGSFKLAGGGFAFQLGIPLVCTFHNSLIEMEDGISVLVAPDCDVVTSDGNVPLESYLDNKG